MENYKEKYEHALDNFKKIKAANKDNNELVDFIEYEYPELKDSEEERIRKWLIDDVKDTISSGHMPKEYEYMAKNAISWLEKQDPQKHEEELERAYKCADEVQYRKGYETAKKELKKQSEQKPTDKVEPKFKVGDWVVWDNKISCLVDNIYQGKESLMYTITDVYNMTRSYSVKGFDNNAHLWTIQDAKDGDVLVTPLPKGYEAGEQIFIFKEINCRDYVSNCIEYYCRVCQGVFYENKIGFMGTTDGIFHPATKEQCVLLFSKMKEAGYELDAEKKELKKIEQKPAWSEEDEKIIDEAISLINMLASGYGEKVTEPITFNGVKMINNVKENLRNLHKKLNHWKPSDEQMKQLGWVAEQNKDNMIGKELMSLYQDLKKLREE